MFFPYSTLPSPRLIPAGACPAPAALCVGLLALSWLRRLRPVRAHAGVEIEHEITQGSTELFCRWQRWKRSLFPGCFAPGGWLHARADWGEGRGGVCVAGLCCSAALRAAASLCAVPPDGAGGGETQWQSGGSAPEHPPLPPPPVAGTPSSPMAALPPAPADPLSG